MSAWNGADQGSWRTAKLGDVCDKITDGTHHSPSNGPTGDFKYVTAKNIRPTGLDLTDITFVDAATHREIYARCDVRKDDILYVKDGATTGRVALNTLEEEFSLLSSVGVLRPNRQYVLPKYLLYALQAPTVKDRMLADVAGVAITRLTLKKLKAAEIPLAPLDKQDYIVAEIEKQFSRLDEAIANLKRVKANLKRYKSAVLKAAVEGRLVPTEAELARREGLGYETGAQLLQRVITARQLTGWRPWQIENEPRSDASALPEGWSRAPLGELAETASGGTPHRDSPANYGGHVPWVKSGELRDGVILSTEESITAEGLENSSAKIFPNGTLCIALYGATVGRLGVLGIDAATNQAVCGIFPEPAVTTAYLRIFLEASRGLLVRLAQGGAQPNISQTILRKLSVPIPPLAEQNRIVAAANSCESQILQVEAEIEANLKRAQGLRASTLATLFGRAGTVS